MADCVFVVLLLCSRSFFVIGAVTGAELYGFRGFCLGLIAGTVVGFCVRRSLGLRGRELTRGYHLRMFERGSGKAPGQLEALVELLRGNRLTMMQCRHIACAYADAVRQLKSCESAEERASILRKRNRQVLEIAYGEAALAAYDQSDRNIEELSEPASASENAD